MRREIRHRAPDLLALAVLALLALVFFWPVTLHLGWIPRGGGDLVSFLWPTYSYAEQSLGAGRLPLWNPRLYSGAPFAADNQSGLFYPVNLLAFLLWPSLPYAAMEWLVVFHVWLAGAGMYWLMRVLLTERGSPGAIRSLPPSSFCLLPSLFSSIAYMFSDVFVTHVGNLNIVAVSAWLPPAFAALHLGLTRRSAGWAAAAGVILGVAALAGHAQMTLVVAGALALYVLWRMVYCVLRIGGYGIRDSGYVIALAALAFAVAFGVSALSVIPAAEMTRFTARARLDYAAASQYSLPWAGLAGLFSPLIFGRGPAGFWGPWDRVALGYLGVLPLFFAGLAHFRGRQGVPLFMGLLAVFGLLVALGANTPLHRLLYLAVPGFAQLRVPARFVLLADFSLAVLGGLGLYRVRPFGSPRGVGWAAVLLVAAPTIVLAAYHSAATDTRHSPALRSGLALAMGMLLAGLALATLYRRRRLAPLLALVLLSADLIGHGAWVEVDRNDPTLGYQHSAALAFLRGRPGPVRIDNASSVWAPDAAALHGLEDIGGISNPLSLAAYQTYLGAVGPRGTPLYNFLNAQFVIADKSRPPGDSSFVPVFDEDPAVDIYLNTNARPRVSLVYSATAVPSGEAAFAAIHAPGFDPASAVVVEGAAAAGGSAAGESGLYYLDYAPESFSVVARTPAPAYVVFSEVWYPGWRAWVDGAEVPVLRADFAFRAAYLAAAGEHTVAMRFEPLSWKVGFSLSLLTLAGLGGWAGALHYRRSKRHAA